MISIYVGNLPYDTTEEQVADLFSQFGEVHRATLVTDRETNRPRGFGFVEMPNDGEARKAIEALSGKDFEGRPMTVNEARNRSAQRNSANLSRSAHTTGKDDKDDNAENKPGKDDQNNNDNDDNSRGYSNKLKKP